MKISHILTAAAAGLQGVHAVALDVTSSGNVFPNLAFNSAILTQCLLRLNPLCS